MLMTIAVTVDFGSSDVRDRSVQQTSCGNLHRGVDVRWLDDFCSCEGKGEKFVADVFGLCCLCLQDAQ